MQGAAQIFNATDPDLHDVMRNGKKILMYHGFGDPGANPIRSIRYRQAVIDFMNERLGQHERHDEDRRKQHEEDESLGERFTDRFLRLYLVPGMAHCGGGVGHSDVDWITPLQAGRGRVAPRASSVPSPARRARALTVPIRRKPCTGRRCHSGIELLVHGIRLEVV